MEVFHHPSLRTADKCYATGKLRAPNRAAGKVLRRQMERKYGKRFSVYRCQFCDGYHLRTTEKKMERNGYYHR